jgi:hypothetical protein
MKNFPRRANEGRVWGYKKIFAKGIPGCLELERGLAIIQPSDCDFPKVILLISASLGPILDEKLRR